MANLKDFYLFINLFCSYFNFLMNFYNMVLIFILIMIIFFFIYMLLFFNLLKKDYLILKIEIFLVLFCFIIILFCFIPSLKVLNLSEYNKMNYFSINIFGYQWYWNYFINNYNMNQKMTVFDDYKLINNYNFFDRNISNNCLFLPFNTNLLFISVSDNVIHSWFIPELNMKLEVNPGFMNYYFNFINKCGIFFGNCAEICGEGHSNMPILIETMPFSGWMNKF